MARGSTDDEDSLDRGTEWEAEISLHCPGCLQLYTYRLLFSRIFCLILLVVGTKIREGKIMAEGRPQ